MPSPSTCLRPNSTARRAEGADLPRARRRQIHRCWRRRLLRRAHEAGLKQSIVSSTARENVELIVRTLGVAGLLDAIVGEEDSERGKPDPQPFTTAAARLASYSRCRHRGRARVSLRGKRRDALHRRRHQSPANSIAGDLCRTLEDASGCLSRALASAGGLACWRRDSPRVRAPGSSAAFAAYIAASAW
jgi:hypothetical protein